MNGFVRIGNGPHKVLALHGWFGDEHTFDPISRALDTDQFTYVSMAYRGYGASKELLGEYSVEEIAQDSLALADRLGWQKFSLLGHSMGGKVAQRILLASPDRINKIVAITPVPANAVPFDDATWQLFEGAAGNDNNRYGIIDFSTGNRLSSAWIRRMAQHSRTTSREAAFAAYLSAWARTDFASLVQGNPVPVKVLIGRHDASITREVVDATFVETYPNCEVKVIEGAGHYPIDETPILTATEIETFLGTQV
jgi:pimeloyl-ACP methyl ester carboxylesterase